MKSYKKSSGRPRPSSAANSSFATPANFSSQFKAFAAVERRDKGVFQVRCLLQWLTRPRTFVFMTLFLLVVPPLWFASTRTPATAQPPAVEHDGRTDTSLRVQQPRDGVEPAAISGDETNPSPPSGPETVKEPTTPRRAQEEPLSPPVLPSREEGRAHGRNKERREHNKKPSWTPPVLPLEVFRDVPPEECVRSPLWDKKVDPSDYEFGCKEINAMLAGKKKLIGNGNIRDVYLVQHKGRKLVLKALREDYELRASKKRADRMHQWEAAALDAIKGHPNMVDSLGNCGANSVSEYFDVRLDDLVLKPGAKPLPTSMVVSMALDAARGLQALHEAPGGAIVHFDIKPQQMMLDAKGRIKINDLNMCKFAAADADGNSCEFQSSASRVGPFRAPENIAGKPLTEKVDVYSLAMVYYCMLALDTPYKGVPRATEMITNGIPPPVDPKWHGGFVEIMQDMWQREPKARPSARRVVERLEILQKKLALQIA